MTYADIQFIATDMDHTLLDEASQLPAEFDQTLAELTALGIQFGVASGRPLYTLTDIFGAQAAGMTLIADNGGVVQHQGELIETHLLPAATIVQLVETIVTATDAVPLICSMEAAIVPDHAQHTDAVLREFYRQIDYVSDITAWRGEADKVTLYLPAGDAQAVHDKLIAPQFGADCDVAVSGPVWIDVTPHGVNKGNAMRTVAKHLGITTDQMMAFGDSFNDAAMLDTVKYGMLMANAEPAMVKPGLLRAPSNTEAGVITVVQEVIAAHRAAGTRG